MTTFKKWWDSQPRASWVQADAIAAWNAALDAAIIRCAEADTYGLGAMSAGISIDKLHVNRIGD